MITAPWELLPSSWYQLRSLSSCSDLAALVFCLSWPWSSFLVLINVFIWSWISLSCMSAPASPMLLPCEWFLIITAGFCEDTLPALSCQTQSLGSQELEGSQAIFCSCFVKIPGAQTSVVLDSDTTRCQELLPSTSWASKCSQILVNNGASHLKDAALMCVLSPVQTPYPIQV